MVKGVREIREGLLCSNLDILSSYVIKVDLLVIHSVATSIYFMS